ncbi:MAG: hypothetical protein HYX53_18630 [Chloroflexi bacterium]|nr:hypothetical protein [Chloroflexota bacterium]
MSGKYRDLARVLLALIRLINGAIGLFAPQLIIKRFDDEEEEPEVARYALRMFGIRTILVAIDLLRPAGPDRSHAMRVAPIVHASDLVAASLAAKSGRVASKTGAMIVAISAVNTLLAIIIWTGRNAGKHQSEDK